MKLMHGFLLILFFSSSMTVFAARGQEGFLQGNKYFAEGNIQGALESYQEIDNKGPVTWYNSALCHVQQGDYVSALVALRRAQKGASVSILKKINFVLEHVQKNLALAPDSFFQRLATQAPSYLSFFWMQILCLIVLLGIVFLTFFHFKKAQWIKFALIITVAGLLYTLCALRWINECTYGIILRESPLYVGPNEQFHTKGTVSVADYVVVKAQEGSWCKIRERNGIGWILASRLSLIE